ncbi:eukaryotic translation initiation factor eIF-1 [Fusarium denticulatum]|uniref:Eukaryotic translation initiation factor eIF-1 n=1 Tax=Fusarium denticulatum TaxID=48507 RepID=A0A8H5U2L2_9HYPO|nr:eukaryotic translation initiation factor eIF-1 [Fusarium denticulatum]
MLNLHSSLYPITTISILRNTIADHRDLDPFAEADEDTGETKQTQNYIHIRIQRGIVLAYNANMVPERNGRKTLTTVQGLPKKFDQKKILKVIKKKFACNGTIVNDSEMGEVIQLQGDQRKDVQEFLIDKKEGLELDAKTIKVHGF